MFKVTDQRNRLQRFAETHFIGQNSVDAILVQRDHPVEAAHLIVAHFTALDVVWRFLKAEQIGNDGVFLEQLLVLLLFGFAMAMAIMKEVFLINYSNMQIHLHVKRTKYVYILQKW